MRKIIQNQYICFLVIFLVIFFQVKICFAEFTIEDEKKLGKEFFDKLEEHQMILDNKKIDNYINNIGKLVLDQTYKAPFDFKFYIVDSSAINAFATPGGYIYINKGLILSAESEAQLAGVIAHEIGHANARHIASIISKSKKLNIAALAAMLAGVFLGGGGEATAAIAALSVAGVNSMTLRYMREHEEEADRLAVEYLAKAGYQPTAMIEFLKIMKQNEFFSKTMPSYLMTHPGTDDRIIYMDSLILSRYRQSGAKNIIGNFSRIQAIIPLDTSELEKQYKRLELSLKNDPNNVDLLYNTAIIEDHMGNIDSALSHYHKALSLSPKDEEILKNTGLLYLKIGKTDLAQEYLLKARTSNPSNDEILAALGRAFYSSGKYQKALDCFLSVKDKESDHDVDINYFIAMTYGNLNNKGDSHYYFGLYFKRIKKKESALFHFRESLNYFPQKSERSIAINEAIKELEAGNQSKPSVKSKNR